MKKPAITLLVIVVFLHTLLITGVTFDEPGEVRDLFRPLVEESRRQFPPR